MGKSIDFSEGIQLIREAHADAVAILSKWRDLIEAPGDITITIRHADGTTSDITLPSIRAAINRYLGGVFEQITLTDGSSSVTIRMNNLGAVELSAGSGTPAAIIAGRLVASRIEGVNGNLPISGKVGMLGGAIQNALIENLNATGGRIAGATFSGTTLISGSTRITGTLTVKTVLTKTLDMGKIQYRKQVVRFGVEGLKTDALNATDGDLWTGDPSILEAAGIYPEPVWADCTYTPKAIIGVTANLHVYWGDSGNVRLMNVSGSYDFWAPLITAWPYKMYEAVPGGYRIRWLPLTDQRGRIHYARTGNSGTSGMACTRIQSNVGSQTNVVKVQEMRALENFVCTRFIAAYEEATEPGVFTTTHIMYRM